MRPGIRAPAYPWGTLWLHESHERTPRDPSWHSQDLIPAVRGRVISALSARVTSRPAIGSSTTWKARWATSIEESTARPRTPGWPSVTSTTRRPAGDAGPVTSAPGAVITRSSLVVGPLATLFAAGSFIVFNHTTGFRDCGPDWFDDPAGNPIPWNWSTRSMGRVFMSEAPFEVCVVGGGPAGSATALHLRKLGHRVCLVERTRFPRAHVGESLTEGIWPIFETLGVRESFLRGGFPNARETLIRWTGPQTERLAHGGRAARASSLTGLIRYDPARRCGNVRRRVFQPAQARRVSRTRSSWRVEFAIAGNTQAVTADYLVDATGRSSFFPKRAKPDLAAYGGPLWLSAPPR